MNSSFAKLSFLTLPLIAFSACQDYEPFSEAEVSESYAVREFTKNFEARYGKIDPNHTWGFGPITVEASSLDTRAFNSNDVCIKEPNTWYAMYLLPPGGNSYWVDRTNWNLANRTNGTVTKDEILFVSEFFRTYNKNDFQNPSTVYSQPSGLISATPVTLHLTDYWIENISKDVDRVDEDGNPCYPNGSHMRQTDNVTDNFLMDHLLCLPFNGSQEKKDNFALWDHINDFNAGKTYSCWTNNPSDLTESNLENGGNGFRSLMYVHSSGTEAFAYHPSANDTEAYYSNYQLMHLVFKVNDVIYDGTYLGFDYECYKKTSGKTVTPDGYYSNWIVKVSGIDYVPRHEGIPCRIMCEDLGNTLDFDFNDVVFDLNYELLSSGDVEAIITLRASGGTLPIYVGNNQLEAHYMLGQNTSSVPVNVGAPGVSHAVATYRITWPNAIVSNGTVTVNPNDIPIWVGSSKSQLDINEITLLPKVDPNAAESAAPQKICIPDVTTSWLKENQQIEWGYGYFDEWVKNQHGQFDFGKTNAWNTTHKSVSSGPNGGAESSYMYGPVNAGTVNDEIDPDDDDSGESPKDPNDSGNSITINDVTVSTDFFEEGLVVGSTYKFEVFLNGCYYICFMNNGNNYGYNSGSLIGDCTYQGDFGVGTLTFTAEVSDDFGINGNITGTVSKTVITPVN